MSETHVRTEYSKALPVWKKIRDCIKGETAIKDATTTYLPMPNETDRSPENLARYDAYLNRAVFYNVTGRTVEGLQAMMFSNPPTFDLTGVEYLEDDCDGSGTPLEQQCKRVSLETVSLGRHGLLTDFPKTEGRVTRLDVERGVRANISRYDAERITNWRTEKVGPVRKLVLVVLAEDYDDEGGNQFVANTKIQYRVLYLDQGVYTQALYRDGALVEERIPTGGDGKALDFIPFVFVGSDNNDDTIDKAPAEDLAGLNVAHFRNSADYEESIFLLGQPTLFIMTDMDQPTFEAHNPGGIQMGSRKAHVISAESKVEMLQMKETSAQQTAMERKEVQMVKIGAKLVETGSAVMTAFQARQESASETSVLADVAQNVSAAYTKAIQWAALFMNVPNDALEYILSKDFGLDELTVEQRQQLISEWQSGLISKSVARSHLRAGAIIPSDVEDAELDEELESDTEGLGLDETTPPATPAAEEAVEEEEV